MVRLSEPHNDLKTSLMLDFYILKVNLYPHLYPRIALDTPVEEYLHQRIGKILGMAANRI